MGLFFSLLLRLRTRKCLETSYKEGIRENIEPKLGTGNIILSYSEWITNQLHLMWINQMAQSQVYEGKTTYDMEHWHLWFSSLMFTSLGKLETKTVHGFLTNRWLSTRERHNILSTFFHFPFALHNFFHSMARLFASM